MTAHQQIAHRWAQNDETLSLKGYAIIAEGRTIYSYGKHFPIAEWFAPGGGFPWSVWFNANGYSSSTAKHKSYVRRAIPHGATVFTLPENLWIRREFFPSEWSQREIKNWTKKRFGDAAAWYEAQALVAFKKASRARSNADWLRGDAERYLAEAAKLAEYLGLTYAAPAFEALKDAADKRAKEQAKAKAKADKARAKAQKEAYAKARTGFEAGERLATYYLFDLDGTALVRRSPDGENLETSRGAVVPWSHAVAIFRKVKACKETGTSWKRNGETLRAGHFQIDEIRADGSMIAGCHSFNWANMEALAIKEGVF